MWIWGRETHLIHNSRVSQHVLWQWLVDSDCSHEIKRSLLLGRKAMTNLDSVKKQRHHFVYKGSYIQSYGFSSSHVWMWEWTIKKTEHRKIDAFELWCWRRLLRVPCTARRSNQPILKEINPEYSLEGLMLKFQYFGHLMQRANSLEKTLMLGKIEGKRRRERQRMRWLDGIINSLDMNLSKSGDQRSLVCCRSWGGKELDKT